MKKLSFIASVLICFILLSSCNQTSIDVPQKVTDTFYAIFPKADDIKWSLENETDFEAEFISEGKEMSACFTKEGDWLETEIELNVDEIPKHILAAFDSNYTGCKIDEAEWVETANFRGYELEIEKGGKDLDIYIAESGKIVKIESDDESAD